LKITTPLAAEILTRPPPFGPRLRQVTPFADIIAAASGYEYPTALI
jgi:hypothetical protein